MDVDAFVASLNVGQWVIWIDGTDICVGLPTRNVDTGLPMLLDQRIHPSPEWTRQQLLERVFTTMQFVLDHELREQFLVDGRRVFDAHALGLTGHQRDWFIEEQGALKGYR